MLPPSFIGKYFPASVRCILWAVMLGAGWWPLQAETGPRMRVEWSGAELTAPGRFVFGEVMAELGGTTASPEAQFFQMTAGKMEPDTGVAGRLEVTRNNGKLRVVFDRSTRTTGYVVLAADEKIGSQGYLGGASQPCAVLIRLEGNRLRVGAGPAPGADGRMRLKIFGYWEPAPGEKGLAACERKAGRTWITLSASPGGSVVVELVKVPDPGLVEWVRRLLQ